MVRNLPGRAVLQVTYYCDDARHLVCVPYSVENLHVMARDLGIKPCWFHAGSDHPHYDIPKRRVAEIRAKCTVVTQRQILAIIGRRVPGLLREGT